VERVWLKHYPLGVPAEIDWRQFNSIGDLFDSSVAKYADRPAYESFGFELTFAELDELSRAVAAWLLSRGLVAGSRVAIMLPNCLQYPVVAFGALRAGLAVVNVNPLYTSRELAHQLSDSGAELIVVLENFASVVEQALGFVRHSVRTVVVATLGDLLGIRGVALNLLLRYGKKAIPPWKLTSFVRFRDVLSQGRELPFDACRVTCPDDIAFLQYTGGTTGVAKGATLLHRNILANLEQAAAWIRPFLDEAEQQVIVTALPLYHVLSLTANCLLMMKIGGCNLLITNPRDIPGFVKTLRRRRFTLITGVNTLYNALMNDPNFERVDFSGLRVSLGGGMAVQKAVADRWKRVTGCTLVEAYGLSETSPAITINPLDITEFNGSIGLPIPSTDIAIRGDDGSELPIGSTGELCVRGPQIMLGYWNMPEETAKVLGQDGYFATGDIASIDEMGFIRIVDRKKDMIVVSGLKVFPNEIEQIVAQLAGVLECVAIGIPDVHSGEVVKLLIVKGNTALTEDDVRRHCRGNLAPYKCPKIIEFRAELPKSNVGKILRRTLRDEASFHADESLPSQSFH
jgi:long-chain acyl-CoA synthetase